MWPNGQGAALVTYVTQAGVSFVYHRMKERGETVTNPEGAA